MLDYMLQSNVQAEHSNGAGERKAHIYIWCEQSVGTVVNDGADSGPYVERHS